MTSLQITAIQAYDLLPLTGMGNFAMQRKVFLALLRLKIQKWDHWDPLSFAAHSTLP